MTKTIEYPTGAKRSDDAGRGSFELLPPRAVEDIAKWFESAGGTRADDITARNWELGIPLSRWYRSIHRHLNEYLKHGDVKSLVAVCWNAVCALETTRRVEEGLLPGYLLDLPAVRQARKGHQPDKRQLTLPLYVVPWPDAKTDTTLPGTEAVRRVPHLQSPERLGEADLSEVSG